MGRVLASFLHVCAAISAMALIGGYLGAIHPLGDSLAVFRLWAAGALLGFAALLAVRRTRFWLPYALFAVLASVPILAIMRPQALALAEPDLRFYTKNILGGRGDTEALLADIRASGADLVFLQEVSLRRNPIRAGLIDSHPHQHLCEFSGWSGIAVLSRWPISEPYCSPHRSIAAARVETSFGALWAVSVHLVWPYPHDQAEVLETALPWLAQVEGPAVVAGDFNMVPWGHSVRQIADVTGTSRVGQLYTTLRPRGVPLQIDHVLTNGQGTTALRPRFGADHHGLSAEIAWP